LQNTLNIQNHASRYNVDIETYEAVWLKNARCKALEIVVFFRCSSLNSATIRLEAAKKLNRFKNFSPGHFLTKQLLKIRLIVLAC
jgi:hypothetical protein